MKFNTRLPVRFKVLRLLERNLYELAMPNNRTLKLASKTPLEVGEFYLATAGDGVFKSPRLVKRFRYLNIELKELLMALKGADIAQVLKDSLINAQNVNDYMCFKNMLISLKNEELELCALHNGLPACLKISSNGAVLEHGILGNCALSGARFCAEFSCVEELFKSL